MKNRLIKILSGHNTVVADGIKIKLPEVEQLADMLIKNGVLVPPVNIGDTVYAALAPIFFGRAAMYRGMEGERSRFRW